MFVCFSRYKHVFLVVNRYCGSFIRVPIQRQEPPGNQVTSLKLWGHSFSPPHFAHIWSQPIKDIKYSIYIMTLPELALHLPPLPPPHKSWETCGFDDKKNAETWLITFWHSPILSPFLVPFKTHSVHPFKDHLMAFLAVSMYLQCSFGIFPNHSQTRKQ